MRRRHVRSLLLVHPRWLLIGLLVLACAGCAKRDWVSELLVLTDVTGTWEGTLMGRPPGPPFGRAPITLVLQQSGPKVTGELSWSRGQGRVAGAVTGEVLTFSEGIKAELAVDGEEMWGQTEDPLFAGATWGSRTFYLRFRRVRAPVPASSEPSARP